MLKQGTFINKKFYNMLIFSLLSMFIDTFNTMFDAILGENHVRIIIRDNGEIFNFVNEENKIESLNAYVLNSLLEKVEDKQYLITTSFNRNGFIFEKK